MRKHRGRNNMAQVNKDMTIMEAIEIDEGIADSLFEMGMHCLGCAMASGETLAEAAEAHGHNPDELISKINAYLASK